MPPSRSDIIGRWSEDLGYTADLGRDTVLDFAADGAFIVTTAGERVVEGQWELSAPGRLSLIVSGNRLGPFQVAMERRRLPLGEFTVLESKGGLLPFDRCRFTRLE